MDEKHWSRWQRRNIEENRFFSQGIDFIEITRRATPYIPNPPKDYAVTIEMAQHLAMMAKTQRAHDYRNYFIECEKVAIPKTDAREAVISKLEKQRDSVISRFVGMD
jgi:anti-repressor protein